MDLSELLSDLTELFELPTGSLNASSVLEETPGWGSLKFLSLIGLFDDRYGIVLKPRQIHQCSTIGDLYQLVSTATKGN